MKRYRLEGNRIRVLGPYWETYYEHLNRWHQTRFRCSADYMHLLEKS